MDELLNKLLAEKAEIEARSAPFRARKEKLVAQIQPLEAEVRDLKLAIEAVEGPRLAEIRRQVSAIEASRSLAKQPSVKECCKTDGNLVEIERRKVGDGADAGNLGEVVVRRCSTCGRRHFEMNADMGRYGIKGSAIGA